MGIGQQADLIANAAVERGQDIPESCIPPDLPDNLVEYVNHFWRLSTCRLIVAHGFPGPIPWMAIDKYIERLGLDDEVLYDDVVAFIEAMDEAYLDESKETAAKNGNSQVVSGKGQASRKGAAATSW